VAKMVNQRNDSKRVPFSEEDGVLCVVVEPGPSGRSFYLQALDVSENGIKLKTTPKADHACAIWETLLLSKIVGTRTVKFADPIELVVKWQENEVDQCVFGCQIRNASPESKKQYVNFVRSETAFGGAQNQSRRQDASRGIDTAKEEDEMAALEERMKSSAAADRPRTRLLAFAGLLALLAVLLLSVLYTCSQNRDLAKRVVRLEERFKMVPAPTMGLEQVQSQLTSLEESLVGLTDLAQENQSAAKSLAGKIQTIEKKLVQIESRPPSTTPASAKEKAKAAAPKETASKKDGGGRFHVVQKGENLFRISVKYDVALDQLANINDMKVNDPIYPGQKIKLP